MSLTPTNEPGLIDAAGKRHEVAATGARIVWLVPSITELLFDLGLQSNMVGRTGFCIHPKDLVRKVPKVGGTKTIDLARIKRLHPTHLIVNIDENPRGLVEDIAKFVPNVVVTHPRSPRDNLDLYRLLGGIFSRQEQAEALCRRFEHAYDEVATIGASWPRQQVLYLIWKAPWMTVCSDTYISRMLATVGWDTVAPNSSARYPTVDLTAAVSGQGGLRPAVERTVHASVSATASRCSTACRNAAALAWRSSTARWRPGTAAERSPASLICVSSGRA